jgi:hypothetical protein
MVADRLILLSDLCTAEALDEALAVEAVEADLVGKLKLDLERIRYVKR